MLKVQYGFVQLNEKKSVTYIYCRGNAIITFNICFGSVDY